MALMLAAGNPPFCGDKRQGRRKRNSPLSRTINVGTEAADSPPFGVANNMIRGVNKNGEIC